MRDPHRIDGLIERLRVAWKRSPDMRLGQLIVNGASLKGYLSGPFYIEDDSLIEGIEELLLGEQRRPQ